MIKQVILMRKDLRNTKGDKVRSGKLMAQSAHAAMIWLSKRIAGMHEAFDDGSKFYHIDGRVSIIGRLDLSAAEAEWLGGTFTKIILGVENEAELQKLVNLAREDGLEAQICVDHGHTEFGFVPTITCAAIGPADSDRINSITGHLKSY